MPDPILLAAILADPKDPARWLALAGWYANNGRDDEAAVVRVFWRALRDNVLEAKLSLEATLADVARHATLMGQLARQVERCGAPDG